MNRMNSEIKNYFDQYLLQLHQEIVAFPEAELWTVFPGITNSGGNLAYHLCGNLNHFIGYYLGDTGYQRNRELEFRIKEVPRSELLFWIKNTHKMVIKVVSNISDFQAMYPKDGFDTEGTIRYQLLRLLTHLSYHIGQINYLRRISIGTKE